MEEHNIIDLISIDNMNIFSQHSGICWLVSSIAMLFFDDNNKLLTFRLFNWAKRDGKIIPVSSVYRDKSKNKKIDLLMYLILEIIRINIKKSILGTYTQTTGEVCDRTFINLFRDFFSILPRYGDCKDPIKTDAYSDGGNNNGFICFFCKYYDFQYDVDREVRVNDPMFRHSYMISELTSVDKEFMMTTYNYHATSIIFHKDNFYFFDGNLIKFDRFHLNHTKVEFDEDLTITKFIQKADKNYESNSSFRYLERHKTLAYLYHEDMSSDKIEERELIDDIFNKKSILKNFKKLNRRCSFSLLDILKESFKEYFECFEFKKPRELIYKKSKRDIHRYEERDIYGELSKPSKKKKEMPEEKYRFFYELLFTSKIYVYLMLSYFRRLLVNNISVWDNFADIHKLKLNEFFGSEFKLRDINNKLKFYFFNYLFLEFPYKSIDEIMKIEELIDEDDIKFKDYPDPEDYIKEKKRRIKYEARMKEYDFGDDYDITVSGKLTKQIEKKEYSEMNVTDIPEYFSFVFVDSNRRFDINDKEIVEEFFILLKEKQKIFGEDFDFYASLKSIIKKFRSNSYFFEYFYEKYHYEFLINLLKYKPKLPIEKLIDNVRVRLYLIEVSNIPDYLKYDGIDNEKICINDSCAEEEEILYRKSILDTHKYDISTEEIIHRYISIFR
jgi:hypothetical protein